jgi:hypothetical protein
MKNSRTLLAYSTSALAVTACLILPGVAGAQTAGAAASDAQPTAVASASATPTPAEAAAPDEVVVTGIRA